MQPTRQRQLWFLVLGSKACCVLRVNVEIIMFCIMLTCTTACVVQ